MKKERVEALRCFIKIIDKEVFGSHACHVSLYKKKHIWKPGTKNRAVAMFTHTREKKYLLKTKFLLYSLFQCMFDILRLAIVSIFIPSQKRRRFSLMLASFELIKLRYLDFSSKLYRIVRTADIADETDIELLTIALHEVRHRIQYEKAYQLIASEEYKMLVNLYDQQFTIHYERRQHYPDNGILKEIDADFVAFNMQELFVREYGCTNKKINKRILINFLRKHIAFMKWPGVNEM
jgi:hypothetical protein